MLNLQLANLRDVLAGVADRLHQVEVSVTEHLPASLLAPATPVPALLCTVSRTASRGRVLPLRQLRLAKGWKQSTLINRLRAVAAREGVAVPEFNVLKTQVSRWENGAPVGPFYLQLFGRVFESHSVQPAPPDMAEAVAA